MRWREIGRTWGTDEAERRIAYPCDRFLPEQGDAWYRGVTVRADPATLFRWLCQLRVAPYSYDWIDNFGRRSPRELQPGVDQLELGQRFMSIFELVEFETNRHLTLRPVGSRWFPPLVVSYCIEPTDGAGCRLLVKLAVQLGPSLRDRAIRALGPWLDGFMMRRQLLNLKELAETSV